MKYENISKELKDKYNNLQTVSFNNTVFKKYIKEMKKIYDKHTKEYNMNDTNQTPLEQAKQDINDMARTIITKINAGEIQERGENK